MLELPSNEGFRKLRSCVSVHGREVTRAGESVGRGGKSRRVKGRQSRLRFVRVTGAWTVPLPPDAAEPFDVYVNGVLQQRGVDYEVEGRALRFSRPLAQEGRLGFIRWASIFLGLAGTYRKHDSVDVAYEVGGRRKVAANLEPLEQAR
jgi:hypothetical protein